MRLLLSLAFCLLAAPVFAGDAVPLELKQGDRVVLLGGTFIERSQSFGEIELALALRYADRTYSVRNLGWSGDTVWAESRGIFGTPQQGYAQMLEQIQSLEPTLVLLAYGQNEALADVPAEKFLTQLGVLVDALSATGARVGLITPHPHFTMPAPLPSPEERNKKLARMSDQLKEFARARSLAVIDLSAWTPDEPQRCSDDGVHLNRRGYRAVARAIAGQCSGGVPSCHLVATGSKNDSGRQVTYNRLPRPHETVTLPDVSPDDNTRSLLISGTGDDAETLAEGRGDRLVIANDPATEALREAIVTKNFLYFQRWRPQNVTYLFLFRKHEQGQNAKEVAEFEPLVQAADETIDRLKRAKPTRVLTTSR